MKPKEDSKIYQRSIEVILENQAPSGAYVASPTFFSYTYSWLRDGSFIAHAMDQVGHPESARAFFRWVNGTILKHAHKVAEIERGMAEGRPLQEIDFLHTRYTVDGEEVTADKTWGNFQPDGYGTWLWALNEHVQRTGDLVLLAEIRESVLLTVRYLLAVWRLPTYDCWEEFPDYVHTYTLAAIYTGLCAADSLVRLGLHGIDQDRVNRAATEIHEFILQNLVRSGRLIKSMHPVHSDQEASPLILPGVDASLLGLCTPYMVFQPEDPIFKSTLAAIEQTIHWPEGGVYRYLGDTYYGGGEWVLLAAWMGWHYARAGKLDNAQALREWVESQADGNGILPEQVNEHPLAPQYYEPWLTKWGPVASPLLWSHAMYILLVNATQQEQERDSSK